MPNHVTIQMTVSGPKEVLDLFIASHIIPIPEEEQSAWSGSEYFDFNTIVPSPASMHSKNDSIKSFVERSKWSDEKRAEFDREEELRAKRNVEKYGYSGWYDWNCANWGTKWNSYDNHINADYGNAGGNEGCIDIGFQTAWSLPEPIFMELTELYPELTFEVSCIEEGGFFYGTAVYANGEADTSGIGTDSEGWTQYGVNEFGWDWLLEDDEDDEYSKELFS